MPSRYRGLAEATRRILGEYEVSIERLDRRRSVRAAHLVRFRAVIHTGKLSGSIDIVQLCYFRDNIEKGWHHSCKSVGYERETESGAGAKGNLTDHSIEAQKRGSQLARMPDETLVRI